MQCCMRIRPAMMRPTNEIQFGNFSYQANPGLRLDNQVPVDPFSCSGTWYEPIGDSGGLLESAGKANTQTEREYYETIIGSHLRRDPHRYLRSSTNRHHLVTDNFKSGDNFDDQHRFNYQQFGNCDRLYAWGGDYYRSGHGQAGAIRSW